MEKNIQEIFDLVWGEFTWHQAAGSFPALMTESRKTISFAGTTSPDEREITEDEAREFIMKWIREDITKYGKVYLYTCKDNAEISFDLDEINKTKIIPKTNEKLGEKQDTEIPFYIGFD